MPTYDFTPLFRTAVGFDRMSKLADRALRMDEQASAYPPYNIEKVSEDDYRITMAVAGFGDSEIDITVQEHVLIVKAKKQKAEDQSDANSVFLHRGIANRSFERRFQLADHIQVTDARLQNGLLHIDLLREVPEALKPRKIEISQTSKGSKSRVIESQAA
ncbi:MAG: Hsp20 family protein [Alphaproteobacteria bacterium]